MRFDQANTQQCDDIANQTPLQYETSIKKESAFFGL